MFYIRRVNPAKQIGFSLADLALEVNRLKNKSDKKSIITLLKDFG